MKYKILGVLVFLIFINILVLLVRSLQLGITNPEVVSRTNTASEEKKPADLKHPKIAVVVNDLGIRTPIYYDLKLISFKLNLGIIPGLKDSNALFKEFSQLGRYEIIMHMPMDILDAKKNLESKDFFLKGKYPYVINGWLNSKGIRKSLDNAMSNMDGYGLVKGLSNHYGSKVTASANMMAAVGKWTKRQNIYFLDSLTTPQTLAYEVLKKNKIKAGYNEIFLDTIDVEEYILEQLGKAQRLAEKNGQVIVFCHINKRKTIEILKREMPRIASENFEFVFVSELVK